MAWITNAVRTLIPFGMSESGLHGAFKRLEDEHAELRTQFWALVTTHDLEQRRERWRKLRWALVIHEHAELRIFRDLEWHPGLIDLVDERESEAQELTALMLRVDEDVADESSCKRAVGTLWAVFSQQTELHDAQYFPVVQHALGEVMCEALVRRYFEARAAVAEEGEQVSRS